MKVSKELTISDHDQQFIDLLFENGGNAAEAARTLGHASTYGYLLKKKLAKHIAEATKQYLALHAPKAANRVVEMMTQEMPNPTHLAAAKEILDRSGVKEKEETQQQVIRPNIFILPEKREIKVIDVIEN